MDKGLIYEILSVVEEIPPGKVATYGQIARLTGREKNARLVGKILSTAQQYGEYPCHRVVNHAGRTVPRWLEQPERLRQEGVPFKENGCVALHLCLWEALNSLQKRRDLIPNIGRESRHFYFTCRSNSFLQHTVPQPFSPRLPPESPCESKAL